jgi:hypothetical protein
MRHTSAVSEAATGWQHVSPGCLLSVVVGIGGCILGILSSTVNVLASLQDSNAGAQRAVSAQTR